MPESNKIKTDIIGEIIEPGVLVAFGRSGENSKDMEIGIVSELKIGKKGTGRMYLFGIKSEWERIGSSYEFRCISEVGVPRKTWSQLSQDSIQGHVIVIKNPYFAISNPVISEQLKVVDHAIDAGLLPKNYQLGMPLSELKKVAEKKNED